MSENAAFDSLSPLTGAPSGRGEPERRRLLGEDTPPNGVASSCAVSAMKLCDNCLNYQFSKETLDLAYRPGGDDPVFTTFGQLVQSAPSCTLCKLVLDGLRSADIVHSTRVQVRDDSPIFLAGFTEEETAIRFYPKAEPDSPEAPPFPDERWVANYNLRVYMRRKEDAVEAHEPLLEVGPEEDLFLTEYHRPRPLPLTPWSEPWLHQLRKWLNDCVDTHGELGCSTTLSGERIDESTPPVLPSRVIDVGPPDGFVSPRLLQTNGASGHYTALSYCWGASEKSERSYLTTTDTLEKHLSSIAWDLLPKTLRDAILLTRAVGLRYLWVDSLCIVQDSTDDWEKESAEMGTVYSQARLVIAATIGADADAGLFPPQNYMYHPGQPSLCFSRPPKASGMSRWALPLFERGWTAQEWILSRRIVFWTHERMCWRCRCQRVSEDGRDIGPESGLLHGEITWIEVVSDYSCRTLTYQSDKLVALDGVVSELSKKRPDDKYAMGTWLSNMPQELLWSGLPADTPTGCEPHRLRFPSWSWVGHPNGVSFMPLVADGVSYDYLEASSYFSFSMVEDFSLQIKTRSKKVDLHDPGTAEYMASWANWGKWWTEIENSQRRAVVVSSCALTLTERAVVGLFVGEIGPWVSLRQITVNREGLSIVFDALDYLSLYRKETGGSPKPDAAPEFLFIEVMHFMVTEGSMWRRGDKRVKGTQWPRREVGGIAGLLLRKVHSAPGRFIRVGVAIAPSDWFQDADVGEFIIE